MKSVGAERMLRLTGHPSRWISAAWSPDGKTLSYSSLDSTGSNVVHLLLLDSLDVKPLPSAPSCSDAGAPAFSPDGTRLAILCTSSVAVFGVYVCPLDGGPAQLIKSMMGHPLGLAWLHDGAGLMVAIDSGEGGSLWQLSLDGTLARLPFGEQGSAPAVAGTVLSRMRGEMRT